MSGDHRFWRIMPCVNQEVPSSKTLTEDKPNVASSVDAAAMPWAFTQHQPLDTAHFISEAERRGVDLDLSTLRELYRHAVIVPFVYVSDRQVGPKPEPIESEPHRGGGTVLTRLRDARDRGRLTDLAAGTFRPRLRFERRDGVDPRRWWDGLIYSWYQLLVLPELHGLLARRTYHKRAERRIVRLPQPHPLLPDRAQKLRTAAIALTALEARYLPKLDPEWIHVTNAELEEWERYRDGFDPVAMSARLGYPSAQARQDAEWLLLRAHSIDPVGGTWSSLMRRAPRDSWKHLKDAALSAMDYREAAEILLRFYEDLADRGEAEPLPDIPHVAWHPLHERLSYRPDTLDQDLMSLGISPHPRVVLAFEGDTEEVHVPLVWKALGYPEAPELVRPLKLGGVDRDLEKVAALAAAPLVGGRIEIPGRESWSLIKPPTRLFIAVDPEGKFAPDRVEGTRTAILNEIKAVLAAQGVTRANPAELDELVEIRTWSESCYEFAHFTDDELADGIMAVHHTIDGWTRDELVAALRYWRDRGTDIKRVWESGRWVDQQQRPSGRWEHEVSKPDLALALWPVLEAKIQRRQIDAEAPTPPIASVVYEAYLIAQRWRYLSFVLSEDPGDTASAE
jgi:hypothetical protein